MKAENHGIESIVVAPKQSDKVPKALSSIVDKVRNEFFTLELSLALEGQECTSCELLSQTVQK